MRHTKLLLINSTDRSRWSRIISRLSRILFLVKVEGESGWPELVPEKYYFATSLLRPKIGDFIVFRNPENLAQTFVKKIKEITPTGYEVQGLVSWSTSGQDFGTVEKNIVLGKLIGLKPILKKSVC